MNKKELINKIKGMDGMTQDERSYLINLVNNKKKYGLVWEDKTEEIEELLREKLPVLCEAKEKAIVNSEDAPNHILIEGDNLPALTTLSFSHQGQFDVIYIDPPYNTGNKDFKYNDQFVDKEDAYRHSKWLSFMAKRLQIAKGLLKRTGVIFMSIDDNEQAQLKLLADEIFGSKNFISNMIWSAGKKNDSKYISNSHEYIIAFFKDIDFIKENKIVWRERKEGIDKIYKTAESFVKKSNGDYEAATIELKKWFRNLSDNDPIKAHSHYSMIDEKGVFFPDNISWPGGGGPKYEVLHPITKKPVSVPSRGWVYSSPERMKEIIDEGRVFFGKDEKSVPTLKSYLKDREYQVPYSVIYQDGRAATKRLMEMFGHAPFGNPKDENIIKKLIQFSSPKNALILDFFAGSGTTLHSTILSNAEDGGSRKCVLITNNENNICEEVTYKRNKQVIEGYTNSKGEIVNGLKNNNLRYYRSEFVSRESTLKNRRELTQLATELLCIKENCYREQKTKLKHTKLYDNSEITLLILFDDIVIPEAVEFIKGLNAKTIKVYVFSMGSDPYTEDFAEVLDKVTLCALPDVIYKAYQNVLPKKKRTTPFEEEVAENIINENGEQLTTL